MPSPRGPRESCSRSSGARESGPSRAASTSGSRSSNGRARGRQEASEEERGAKREEERGEKRVARMCFLISFLFSFLVSLHSLLKPCPLAIADALSQAAWNGQHSRGRGEMGKGLTAAAAVMLLFTMPARADMVTSIGKGEGEVDIVA